ncbi:MAG: pantoate--beta-alanine ligase [Cellvibrionaceae bacterium]|jgi:pantoate--beta-alanine ligase
MQLYRHIQPLREILNRNRTQGRSIAFVPTMGNLHSGHLALLEQAKMLADLTIVSIFVNPLQFGLNEDWDQYPRTFEADCQKLKRTGCDILFFPEDCEIYPNGMAEQTRVTVPAMTERLCGASRDGHFEGVTTVVSKLLNIIQPDKAIFGLKDFQQIAVIRRMVEDLCMPVEIIAGDIVREADGLAMSSRNGFITVSERPRANQLNKILNWLVEKIQEGHRDYQLLEDEGKQQLESAGFHPDYLEVCCSHSLKRAGVDDCELTVLGAMFTQQARLIDNVSLKLVK